MLLGLVTTGGTSYVPSCDDAEYDLRKKLVRTDSLSGKGVKKATNITPIFLWSGRVCDIVATPDTDTSVFCCVDADSPADGIYEHCDSLADLQQADPTLTECPDAVDISAPAYGGLPYSTVYANCAEYTNDWVFNVAEFVDYMWSVEKSGAYNINVRFYPCSEQPDGACGEIGSSN
jgi:hypothetical protein